MPSAALIRTIASLLLLLCFVLPLTKCSQQRELIVDPPPGAAPASPNAPIQTVPLPSIDTFYYGYELLAADALAVRDGKSAQIGWLAAGVLAFFAPCATLWMREPRCSGAQFIAAFPSLYFLIPWTFIGTPQIGGLLALTCWACLLGLSTYTLWSAFRQRRRS